ncbi:hypothetical protein H1C71_027895, partial [Ictidomys tridecemlineatus]
AGRQTSPTRDVAGSWFWLCGSSQPPAHLRGPGFRQTLILGAESTWGRAAGRLCDRPATWEGPGAEPLRAGPSGASSGHRSLRLGQQTHKQVLHVTCDSRPSTGLRS